MLALLFLCLLPIFAIGLAWGLIKLAFAIGAGIGYFCWLFIVICIVLGILIK